MTPPRDVDELASALLDGLLDPEAADAARRDPAIAGRAAEMQAAREALRAVPPLDPARRDDAIAAALRAADSPVPEAGAPDPVRPEGIVPPASVPVDPAAAGGLDAPIPPATAGGPGLGVAAGQLPGAGTAPGHRPPSLGDASDRQPSSAEAAPGPRPPAPGSEHAGGPRVTPLGSRRQRRWTDPRWLGAAAAIVLIVALGALLAGQSSSSDDSGDAETAGRESASTMADEGAGEAEAGGGSEESREPEGQDDTAAAAPDEATPEGAPDLSTEQAAGPVVELGAVDSDDALAERVRSALDDPAASEDSDRSQSADGSAGCDDPLDDENLGPLVLRGRATLDGQAVDVWVHDDGRTRRMAATDASCAVVTAGFVPG